MEPSLCPSLEGQDLFQCLPIGVGVFLNNLDGSDQ